jgi:hypothetical protein
MGPLLVSELLVVALGTVFWGHNDRNDFLVMLERIGVRFACLMAVETRNTCFTMLGITPLGDKARRSFLMTANTGFGFWLIAHCW